MTIETDDHDPHVSQENVYGFTKGDTIITTEFTAQI